MSVVNGHRSSSRGERPSSRGSDDSKGSDYGGKTANDVGGRRVEDLDGRHRESLGADPSNPSGGPAGASASHGIEDEEVEGDFGSVDLEAKVEALFPLYSHGDTEMPVMQLHSLLQEVGLNIGEAELRQQVGEEKIDLDQALDIATQLHAAELHPGVTLIGVSEAGTQLVSPWQYMKMKMMCRSRQGVKYSVVWPKLEFELSPRKILLGGTLLMLLFTSLAVIGTVAALWVDTETAREKRILDTVGSTVSSFAELFESNWVTIAGAEAESETDVFTSFLGQAHVELLTQELRLTTKRTECVSTAMERCFLGSSISPQVDKVQGKLRQLRSFYRNTVNLASVWNSTAPYAVSHSVRESILSAMVQGWTNENSATQVWDVVLYNTTTSSLLTTSRFHNETLLSPLTSVQCIQHITDAASSFSSSSTTATAQERKDASVLTDLSPSADLQGRTSLVHAVTFPPWGLGVCAFYRSDVYQVKSQADRLAQVAPAAAILKSNFNTDVALSVLYTNASNGGQPINQWLPMAEPKGAASSSCYQAGRTTQVAAGTVTCNEIDTMAVGALLSKTTNSSIIISWNNTQALCAVVTGTSNVGLTLCVPESVPLNVSRDESVKIIDHLNFNFVRSTEIVASYLDEETGVMQAQISAYRFFDGCFAACERTLPSTLNVIAAFDNKGSGFSITPDYRPEPIMGGYKYSFPLRMAYLIERDIIEIRGRASDVLILILDDYNRVAKGAEIVATRPEQYPPMKTFIPTDPCPTGVTCFDAPGHGIVFRGDCIHCQRLLDPEIKTLTFLTSLNSLPAGCNRSAECSDAVLSQYDLYHKPFSGMADGSELTTVTTTGYLGKSAGEVLAGYSFLTNLSLGIVTQWPQSNFQDPIWERIGLSIGVALLFVVCALFTLMFQSRRYLDDIELDWKKYKEQISEENERFSETVLEVLPSRVAERMMKGELLFAESKAVTIMMVNYVGFQEKVSSLPAPMLALYSSYTFLLVSDVCRHFRVHKVRTVGDLVVAAGGISGDDTGNDTEATNRTAVRTVHAACVILQLFSYLFDHSMSEVAALSKMNTGGILERANDSLGKEPKAMGVPTGKGDDTKHGKKGNKQGTTHQSSTVKKGGKGEKPGGKPLSNSGSNHPSKTPPSGPQDGHRVVDANGRRQTPPTKGKREGATTSALKSSIQQEMLTALEMPNVKIGINQGTCMLCVLSCFKTPNFDVVGPTVSIAQRLQSGAKRNTINISQSVTDSLEKLKATENLTISAERRQTLKNALIRSHLILGANIPVPAQVLHSLGIRRSHPRMYFGDDAPGPKPHADNRATHSSATHSSEERDRAKQQTLVASDLTGIQGQQIRTPV